MNQLDIENALKEYIENEFLGQKSSELNEDSPLLEWGVLNSMNIAKLMNFVREDIGVTIPPYAITGQNFKSIKSIADLILEQISSK